MQKVKIELSDAQKVAGPTVGFFERMIFFFLALVPIAFPIFFVPGSSVPFYSSKVIFLAVVTIVPLLLWIILRLKDGRFTFPKSYLLIVPFVPVAVAFISALFAPTAAISLVGQLVEPATVAMLFICTLLFFIVSVTFDTRERIFYAYLLFFVGAILLGVFHVLRVLFGPTFLSLGVIRDITATPIGKWNDLSIFFGVSALLSMVTLELISLSKFFKWVLYGIFILSLGVLCIVNFLPVWYVLGIFCLALFAYTLVFDRKEPHATTARVRILALRKIPRISVVVFVMALVFIFAGGQIGDFFAKHFNTLYVEAKITWVGMQSVSTEVLKQNPLLGSGPNRFLFSWAQYKPDSVNPTPLWNLDFESGVGFIPTMMVSTGILGIVAWLLFIALYLYVGFRSMVAEYHDKVARYLITSSFLASLFLWTLAIFYNPSVVLLGLTFFFTGLFVASLCEARVIKPRTISFIDDPRMGFGSVLILVLFLIATVTFADVIGKKFIAAVYFQRGVTFFNEEKNTDAAERNLIRATQLDPTPAYFRALAQIDMVHINTLFTQTPDAIRTQFKPLFDSAISHAKQAVLLDQGDYRSWMAIGQVYEAVVPLKIPQVYENATKAYLQALALNPKNPAINLILARLEISQGSLAKGKEYVVKALQQKNNYTDAIFLLSQIQIQEGDLQNAITSVEAASFLAPDDSGVFFQLGLLRYNVKDFAGAITALEQAIKLNPSYANAQYFLGLSYQRVGRIDDAIKQFSDLRITNPDNQEVILILNNLKSGKAPFANAQPPIDSKPEKRAKPPVTEKSIDPKKRKATIVPKVPEPSATDEFNF